IKRRSKLYESISPAININYEKQSIAESFHKRLRKSIARDSLSSNTLIVPITQRPMRKFLALMSWHWSH
ncbi:hypothetical protein CU098_007041, partial [Rhizopus stolonifer]